MYIYTHTRKQYKIYMDYKSNESSSESVKKSMAEALKILNYIKICFIYKHVHIKCYLLNILNTFKIKI